VLFFLLLFYRFSNNRVSRKKTLIEWIANRNCSRNQVAFAGKCICLKSRSNRSQSDSEFLGRNNSIAAHELARYRFVRRKAFLAFSIRQRKWKKKIALLSSLAFLLLLIWWSWWATKSFRSMPDSQSLLLLRVEHVH